MSTSQGSPRRSQIGSALGTAMVVAGVLVAIAVAVTMLALTTAYRSSVHLTGPTATHPTAAQVQPSLQRQP